MSVIATNKMIPHATAHLEEDSPEDFLGNETPTSITEIIKKKKTATLMVKL